MCCGITSCSAPNTPGEVEELLGFFLLLKGLEVCLKAKLRGRKQNVLFPNLIFLPCEFFLLAQKQDSSWTALTEVLLITRLENVLWLGRAAGWKQDVFSGAGRELLVLTPLTSCSHTSVDGPSSWHWVFKEGTTWSWCCPTTMDVCRLPLLILCWRDGLRIYFCV